MLIAGRRTAQNSLRIRAAFHRGEPRAKREREREREREAEKLEKSTTNKNLSLSLSPSAKLRDKHLFSIYCISPGRTGESWILKKRVTRRDTSTTVHIGGSWRSIKDSILLQRIMITRREDESVSRRTIKWSEGETKRGVFSRKHEISRTIENARHRTFRLPK